MSSALLLIDLQNDFCAGGALAVNEGDRVIPVANQAMALCQQRDIAVVASLDWHPADHGSFAQNANAEVFSKGDLNGLEQVWWPVHCVQHQSGAALHPELQQQLITHSVYKGQDPAIDSYSAFFDNGRRGQTLLDGWLKQQQISQLIVMGLATDYCVKFSVLDALSLGYQVQVITDGCRGVNFAPEDSQNALLEMQRAGAKLVTLAEFAAQA